MLNIDLVRLDEDPLLREQVVGILRLLHEDFPAGLCHTTLPGRFEPLRDGLIPLKKAESSHCLMCNFEAAGIFRYSEQERRYAGWTFPMRIHPDFVPFIQGTEDQDYINAIRAWVAMQGIVEEAQ